MYHYTNHQLIDSQQTGMLGRYARWPVVTSREAPRQSIPFQTAQPFSPAIALPPPVPTHTISLPSLLGNTPVRLHPFLRFSHVPSKLEYDIVKPAHTAYLKGQLSDSEWSDLPAVDPPLSHLVTSLTIRISGIARPVVIFPKEGNGSIITIWDVFNGVHKAIRKEVEEIFGNDVDTVFRHPVLQQKFGIRPKGEPSPTDKFNREQRIYQNMKDFFGGGKQIWAGLYPSRTEPDVWVLFTREQDRKY